MKRILMTTKTLSLYIIFLWCTSSNATVIAQEASHIPDYKVQTKSSEAVLSSIDLTKGLRTSHLLLKRVIMPAPSTIEIANYRRTTHEESMPSKVAFVVLDSQENSELTEKMVWLDFEDYEEEPFVATWSGALVDRPAIGAADVVLVRSQGNTVLIKIFNLNLDSALSRPAPDFGVRSRMISTPPTLFETSLFLHLGDTYGLCPVNEIKVESNNSSVELNLIRSGEFPEVKLRFDRPRQQWFAVHESGKKIWQTRVK